MVTRAAPRGPKQLSVCVFYPIRRLVVCAGRQAVSVRPIVFQSERPVPEVENTPDVFCASVIEQEETSRGRGRDIIL